MGEAVSGPAEKGHFADSSVDGVLLYAACKQKFWVGLPKLTVLADATCHLFLPFSTYNTTRCSSCDNYPARRSLDEGWRLTNPEAPGSAAEALIVGSRGVEWVALPLSAGLPATGFFTKGKEKSILLEPLFGFL